MGNPVGDMLNSFEFINSSGAGRCMGNLAIHCKASMLLDAVGTAMTKANVPSGVYPVRSADVAVDAAADADLVYVAAVVVFVFVVVVVVFVLVVVVAVVLVVVVFVVVPNLAAGGGSAFVAVDSNGADVGCA